MRIGIVKLLDDEFTREMDDGIFDSEIPNHSTLLQMIL
jgi:hypothetical protein